MHIAYSDDEAHKLCELCYWEMRETAVREGESAKCLITPNDPLLACPKIAEHFKDHS